MIKILMKDGNEYEADYKHVKDFIENFLKDKFHKVLLVSGVQQSKSVIHIHNPAKQGHRRETALFDLSVHLDALYYSQHAAFGRCVNNKAIN